MTQRFRYQAFDAAGRMIRGDIAAEDSAEARGLLREKGLTAMSVSARTRLELGALGQIFDRSAHRMPAADLAVFTRQMATLLGSGVQIEVALAALGQQSHPRLAAHCQALRTSILDGDSFATALRTRALGLDRFYLTSIEAAERAGRHGAVMRYLADHAEARLRNRQTIGLAMIYPAILIIVSIAVVVGLLVFLLPDIVRVFAARGAELPTLTKLMIGLSDFLAGNAALLGLGLIGVIGAVPMLLRRAEIRPVWHRLLWRVGLARQVTIVQFTGTLATLTQSGVPLADALASASATVGNETARQILQDVTRDVRDGAGLSRALGRHKGFDPMMLTMIASGEASGALPAMLARFSQDQSLALQARVKALVGLVEPLVLLALGGVVMLLVLAILMPIVNLNTLVG
ncbi:General secretion pathway protein F [Candidatus Rhodobacter oscarellae]|uniref:General secretion pathway protein F n=1 Tax=Candidatus Rhodobacter oscarellae TaxID=1675527 RepID=A0A0J9H0Y6_9RHOB|nr:type II secretion system F family protein [Candidatus Rhodobacter lobularis]KMW59408.1 General secretion pathway protein F [Candidatus Rhodobacter lobularis]